MLSGQCDVRGAFCRTPFTEMSPATALMVWSAVHRAACCPRLYQASGERLSIGHQRSPRSRHDVNDHAPSRGARRPVDRRDRRRTSRRYARLILRPGGRSEPSGTTDTAPGTSTDSSESRRLALWRSSRREFTLRACWLPCPPEATAASSRLSRAAHLTIVDASRRQSLVHLMSTSSSPAINSDRVRPRHD